jgi:hypothetical protein
MRVLFPGSGVELAVLLDRRIWIDVAGLDLSILSATDR